MVPLMIERVTVALLFFYSILSVSIVGYVILMTEAFRQSMVWGIITLVPPLAVVYGVWHIRQQWKGTLLMVMPFVLLLGILPRFAVVE